MDQLTKAVLNSPKTVQIHDVFSVLCLHIMAAQRVGSNMYHLPAFLIKKQLKMKGNNITKIHQILWDLGWLRFKQIGTARRYILNQDLFNIPSTADCISFPTQICWDKLHKHNADKKYPMTDTRAMGFIECYLQHRSKSKDHRGGAKFSGGHDTVISKEIGLDVTHYRRLVKELDRARRLVRVVKPNSVQKNRNGQTFYHRHDIPGHTMQFSLKESTCEASLEHYSNMQFADFPQDIKMTHVRKPTLKPTPKPKLKKKPVPKPTPKPKLKKKPVPKPVPKPKKKTILPKILRTYLGTKQLIKRTDLGEFISQCVIYCADPNIHPRRKAIAEERLAGARTQIRAAAKKMPKPKHRRKVAPVSKLTDKQLEILKHWNSKKELVTHLKLNTKVIKRFKTISAKVMRGTYYSKHSLSKNFNSHDPCTVKEICTGIDNLVHGLNDSGTSKGEYKGLSSLTIADFFECTPRFDISDNSEEDQMFYTFPFLWWRDHKLSMLGVRKEQIAATTKVTKYNIPDLLLNYLKEDYKYYYSLESFNSEDYSNFMGLVNLAFPRCGSPQPNPDWNRVDVRGIPKLVDTGNDQHIYRFYKLRRHWCKYADEALQTLQKRYPDKVYTESVFKAPWFKDVFLSYLGSRRIDYAKSPCDMSLPEYNDTVIIEYELNPEFVSISTDELRLVSFYDDLEEFEHELVEAGVDPFELYDKMQAEYRPEWHNCTHNYVVGQIISALETITGLDKFIDISKNT